VLVPVFIRVSTTSKGSPAVTLLSSAGLLETQTPASFPLGAAVAVAPTAGVLVGGKVAVGGMGVLVGVGWGVGVSVGRATAVRVKSTATVSAMLVIIWSGLVVGVDLAHAESSRVKMITTAYTMLETDFLFMNGSILRENYLMLAHDFQL